MRCPRAVGGPGRREVGVGRKRTAGGLSHQELETAPGNSVEKNGNHLSWPESRFISKWEEYCWASSERIEPHFEW